jgi:hypothetical protein
MMQKFNKGDLVHIAKDLGTSMRHFTADVDAIVIGSYFDQFRCGNKETYTLFLKGRGEVSWYLGSQMTLLETGRYDLLEEWEAERNERIKRHSDLDWIFANGAEVYENATGTTAQALASCFGLHNLWGPSGEGFVFHENALGTMELAKPYLLAGDKEGWLVRCEELRRLL